MAGCRNLLLLLLVVTHHSASAAVLYVCSFLHNFSHSGRTTHGSFTAEGLIFLFLAAHNGDKCTCHKPHTLFLAPSPVSKYMYMRQEKM